MIRNIVFSAAILLILSKLSTATTYYVSMNGHDTDNGTTWNTAWRTLNPVNTRVSSGDTVFFGTGIWRGTLIPISGTFSDRTVYACSSFAATNGSGQYHFAQIYGSDSLYNWTQISGNVYITQYTSAISYPTIFQSTGGEIDTFMYGQADSASVNAPGEWWYGNGHIVAYAYGGGDPDNYHMEITQRNAAHFTRPGAGGQDYVTFYGLAFKYADDAAIRCSESPVAFDSFFVDHCILEYVGGWAGTNTSLYRTPALQGGDTHASRWNRVRACSLGVVVAWDGGFPQTEGGAHGDCLHFYNWRYGTIDSCSFYGYQNTFSIAFKCTYNLSGWGASAYNTGNVIAFNTLDKRSGFTHAAIQIWGNVDSTWIYGNIFKYGGTVGGSNYSTIQIQPHESNCCGIVPGHTFIYNNTFYNCAYYARSANFGGASAPDYLYNNEFKYNVGYNPANIGPWEGGIWVDSSSFWAAIDSNLYFSIDSTLFNVAYQGPFSYTVWQDTGFDVHSRFYTDPLLDDTLSFARSGAPQEMNHNYGGRIWTRFGAIQGNPPPDSTGPTFNNIRATDTTSNSVNIRWNTNEPATSQVDYGTDTNYGSSTQLNPSLVYSHAQTITGLSPSTTYHYRVRSRDYSGNESISGDYTFVTLEPDVTPPIISGVTAGDIGISWAYITWTTNEVATSQVNYGLTTGYGQSSPFDQSLVLNHSVPISGLEPDTLYHFRVRSIDAAGNESVSGDYTFHTDSMMTLIPISSGASVNVCGTYPGYSIVPINDDVFDPRGGTSTTWASDQSSSSAHWVEMVFDSPMIASQAEIHWAWNTFNSTWMCSAQYYIQYWDSDANAYVDAAFVDNSSVDSITVTDFGPVNTTRIRYYQPANMGPPNYPSIVWVTELRVYGIPGLPIPEPIGTEVNLQDSSATTMALPVDAQMPVYYEFALDTIMNFPSPRIEPPLVVDTVISTVFDGLSSAYTYYWRCRAIASDQSDTSSWSPITIFNLYSTDLEAYSGAYPENDETVSSNFPHFEIAFIPIPESVYFEIDSNIDFSFPLRSGPVVPDFSGKATWQPDSSSISTLFRQNGEYYWRASTDNANWTVFKVNLKLDVHPYPVPLRESDGVPGITFTNLPENSKISIATVSGSIVLTKSGVGPGEWLWDVRNDRGNKLSSGVYLYAVESTSGNYQGKLMIIR